LSVGIKGQFESVFFWKVRVDELYFSLARREVGGVDHDGSNYVGVEGCEMIGSGGDG
jgi:hypothetical protein